MNKLTLTIDLPATSFRRLSEIVANIYDLSEYEIENVLIKRGRATILYKDATDCEIDMRTIVNEACEATNLPRWTFSVAVQKAK